MALSEALAALRGLRTTDSGASLPAFSDHHMQEVLPPRGALHVLHGR